MQAIARQNHRQFCNLIEETQATAPAQADHIDTMRSELCLIFDNYQQRLDEVRGLIAEYNIKKKEIHNKIKQLARKRVKNERYKAEQGSAIMKESLQ